MSEHRVPGVLHVLLSALAALSLSACQQPVGGASGPGADGRRDSTAPSGYGVVFLGPADCSSRGDVVREVSCRSEKAAARVLTRYTGAPSEGPACPPSTDFVLHISRSGPSQEPAVPGGYACMRNLESPHPGDPGQGGGPLTVVGDCVYGSRKGEVRETACDGSGERPPEFEVGSAVERRGLCPDTTDLFVQLGGETPVGCARRV
ncbi:hypothetical protein [Streptomyces sp. NPDC056452]|uniref:hypothetical protein n=1 Tax=Streptomyces sp. NPDC056452 TaxID=3345821 RepID=UPI0036A26951